MTRVEQTVPASVWDAVTRVALDDENSRIQTRFGLWVLLAALAPAVAIEIRTALTRPLWNDEIYSVTVAALRSPSAIWRALSEGVDTMPPFFYIVTSLGGYLIENVHLASRLPGLVGFFCAAICLYLFVQRRLGFASGWIAALLVVLSGVQAYATEARPYGFVTGCLALSLLCWQRLESSRWLAVPFILSMTAAVASHYYAVLSVPAFAVGEALRWYRTKEVRYPVWLGLIVCLAPIFVAIPLINVVRTIYGGHFWARSTLRGIVYAYTTLIGLGAITIPVIVVVGVSLLRNIGARMRRQTESSDGHFQLEELGLAFVLICLPIITYVAANLAHGGLLMRYVLPTMLGLAIGTAGMAAQLGRKATLTLLAVLAITYAFNALTGSVALLRGQSRSAAQNSTSPLLEEMLRGLDSAEPVVVSSGTDYTSLAYYSRPDIQERLVTLVDLPAALETVGSDSVERAGMILKRYRPLHVEEFTTFRIAHPQFLLFSTGNQFDYWPGRLSREGHLVRLRSVRGTYRLYEVQLQK